jgi:hypothetical protein
VVKLGEGGMTMDASAQQALRIVRILKWSFILAGVMFIYLVVRIPAHAKTTPSTVFELMMSVIALVCVTAGFFIPKILPTPATPPLLNNSASAPVKRWFTLCIMSLAYFDACNLLAVVMHFIGARVRIVELIFTIGMLSLIFWNPGTPPTAEKSMIVQN